MLSSNVVSEEFVRRILKVLQRYEKNEILWSNECAEVIHTKSRFDCSSRAFFDLESVTINSENKTTHIYKAQK